MLKSLPFLVLLLLCASKSRPSSFEVSSFTGVGASKSELRTRAPP